MGNIIPGYLYNNCKKILKQKTIPANAGIVFVSEVFNF